MPVYLYRGYRSDNSKAVGIIDAESQRGANQKLRKNGIFPVNVIEQEQARHTLQQGAPFMSAGGARSIALSQSDLALLTRQLGTLIVAGLPLVDALGVLIEQATDRPLQSLLADIREQVRGGSDFSAALGHFPDAFPSLYIHMIRAGEAGGILDQILFRLADFLEKQQALKHKVTNALLYPAVLSVVGALIVMLLLTFVVPKITTVFSNMHEALPWPTVVLMAMSTFLNSHWLLLLLGSAATIAAARRAARTHTSRAIIDRWLLRIPLIGEVLRKVAVSRLTATLSTMLASGVGLLQAMEIAKRVTDNHALEAAVEHAQESVREGESLAEPLRRSGEFPPLVTHMIAVGEKSGELESMLQRIAIIFESDVDRVVARSTSLIEPIMIVLMGVVVLFIVGAILLPIFQMGQMVR
jgi:general secretion pathway protein F